MDPFLLKLAASFLIAGTWITAATVISERLGTKIGGLVANMPSNGLVSLFFIGLTQGETIAAKAAESVPLGMTIDAFFLFAYIIALRKWGKYAFVPSLAVWAVLALVMGSTINNGIAIGTVLYAIVTIGLFFYSEKKMHIPSQPKKRVKYTMTELIARGLFAGSVVACAVIGAKMFGPAWGGILSVFPATMFSSMFLINRAQGPEFARATGKVMLLGSANIVVFALFAHVTFVQYGLWLGTLLAYGAAAAYILLIHPLVEKIS